MDLLVAAEMASFADLVRLCENALVARIAGDEDNAWVLRDFAEHYADSRRLKHACDAVLENAALTYPVDGICHTALFNGPETPRPTNFNLPA